MQCVILVTFAAAAQCGAGPLRVIYLLVNQLRGQGCRLGLRGVQGDTRGVMLQESLCLHCHELHDLGRSMLFREAVQLEGRSVLGIRLIPCLFIIGLVVEPIS